MLQETMQMNLPSYIQKVAPRPAEPEKDKEIQKSCDAGPSSSSSSGIATESRKIECQDASKIAATPEVSPSSPPKVNNIDDVRMCKICYSEELGVVFLPCGHMVACVKCAPGMTSCALCRQPVSMTVRAFFS